MGQEGDRLLLDFTGMSAEGAREFLETMMRERWDVRPPRGTRSAVPDKHVLRPLARVIEVSGGDKFYVGWATLGRFRIGMAIYASAYPDAEILRSKTGREVVDVNAEDGTIVAPGLLAAAVTRGDYLFTLEELRSRRFVSISHGGGQTTAVADDGTAWFAIFEASGLMADKRAEFVGWARLPDLPAPE